MKRLIIPIGLYITSTFGIFAAGNVHEGKEIFDSKCSACHSLAPDPNKSMAPALADTTKKHTEQWLHSWIQHPDSPEMQKDPYIVGIKNKYPVPMANFGLSDKQADDVIAYLKSVADGNK